MRLIRGLCPRHACGAAPRGILKEKNYGDAVSFGAQLAGQFGDVVGANFAAAAEDGGAMINPVLATVPSRKAYVASRGRSDPAAPS